MNKFIEERGNLSENSESSSSEAEDEDAFELTEQVERNFFKTLSSLKKKDPQIYEKETRFFGTKPELHEEFVKEKRKKKSEGPLSIRKYETSILLNQEAGSSNENDRFMNEDVKKVTYAEEQNQLKESLKKVLNDHSSDENEEEIGGLFHEHKKTKTERETEEAEYRKWLKGQQNKIEDKNTKNDLEYLHDYWNDPDLDEGEKFLRDYILNKKFLDESKPLNTPADLITLEEDEKALTEQTEFENKYNFRFEEPDREFIKRYPRTMENSLRRKDERRKVKRQETAKRKKEEKEQKKLELKKMKELKYQEIKEKIAKLKNLTGNPELGFQDEDIEKEFDPDEHNLKMQKLFSDDFYNQEEIEKPVFDDDDDLGLDSYGDDGLDAKGTHCEDPDFIMDCDYDPEQAMMEKIKKSEAREKQKRKKKLKLEVSDETDDLNIDKNAVDESIQKDLEDYHKFDCEDIIEDTPIRFKYRQVVPNDFGLTIDEILAADDKELDKWCSMQKIYQVRPEEVELYDVKAYKKKAKNEELKRKILPSLYKTDVKKKPKKKKKKKKILNGDAIHSHVSDPVVETIETLESPSAAVTNQERNKKLDNKEKKVFAETVSSIDDKNILESTNLCGSKTKINKEKEGDSSISAKKADLEKNVSSKDHENEQTHSKKKNMKRSKSISDENSEKIETSNFHEKEETQTSKKVKLSNSSTSDETSRTSQSKMQSMKSNKKLKRDVHKRKKLFGKTKFNPINIRKSNHDKSHRFSKGKKQTHEKGDNSKPNFYSDISDSRLKAYGIKPKLFKNKLKYGKSTVN